MSLFWSVKISSHYVLSVSFLVNVTGQTLSRQLECLVVYFQLMGWWKSKLCNMIKKAIFLSRSIYFSQHSHTLGKEKEKWTQFMGSSYTQLPGTRRQRKTNTTPICRSVVWCTFCITVAVAPYGIDLYHTFEKETLENRHTFC